MDKPPVIILAGVRWDFLWQRHQILATLFARAGYPTIFVETTGLANPRIDAETLRKVLCRLRRSGRGGERHRVHENLLVYSPLVAPPTFEAFRLLNERLLVPRVVRDLRKLAGREPIVVAYPPTRTTLDIVSGMKPRILYYDCSDDYGSFPGVPKNIEETERALIQNSDLVSCTSTRLLKKVRATRPDAFLSGPGVDYERFSVLQNGPNRKVQTGAFFGDLSRERIDFEVLEAIAGAGFTVRLVGSVSRVDRKFLKAPGLDFRGEVSHSELPKALRGVDAFVLPYRINALTRSISPAKTYECLATGKPVVAAPLPSMRELGESVYLARRPEEYVEALRSLERRETEEKRRARIELAQANSWEERFEEVEREIWRAMQTG